MFFGGGQHGAFKAVAGAFRLLQGATNSKRRLPPHLGFVILGAVLLLVVRGDGTSCADDSFTWCLSKRTVEALPFIVIVGGCAWLISLSQSERPDEFGRTRMAKKDARAAALALVNRDLDIRQESTKKETSIGLPIGGTHYQVMERRPEPPAPPPSQNNGPLRVPTFAQLREVEPFKPGVFVPGVSNAGLVRLPLEKAGPGTVTGKQGTHKTGLLVLAVAEWVDAGGRVIVIDPEAGHPQSLVNRIGPLADERILRYPMGTDKQSCKQIMKMAYLELDEVIDKNLPTEPTLMVMDEANATATLGDKETREAFRELVKLMTWKARKREWSLIMAIQRPTEKDTGNDGLLQPFGWAMSGQIEHRVADRALRSQGKVVPEDIGMLPMDGTFYLADPLVGQIVKVHIPMVSMADLHAIAEKRLARETVAAVAVLNGRTPEALVTTAPQPVVEGGQLRQLVEDVDTEPGETPQEPLAKLRRLHMEEKWSNKDVIIECFGEETEKGGRSRRDALRSIAKATVGCTCGDPMHERYEAYKRSLAEKEHG